MSATPATPPSGKQFRATSPAFCPASRKATSTSKPSPTPASPPPHDDYAFAAPVDSPSRGSSPALSTPASPPASPPGSARFPSSPPDSPSFASYGPIDGIRPTSTSPVLSSSQSPPLCPSFEDEGVDTQPEDRILLENHWSFWYDKYAGPGLSAQEYEANLKCLGTFSCVQEFWRWFNNLPEPEALGPRSSMHLMKHGIKPLWEDPANTTGGNLCIKIRKQDTPEVWLRLLTATVGEHLSFGVSDLDQINGVTCSIRKSENVIDIWNEKSDLMSVEKLMRQLKKLIPGIEFTSPTYKVHSTQTDFKK